MITKMCSGDNTAAIVVARTIRGHERNTAGAINEIVRARHRISPQTGLEPKMEDPNRFTYGHVSAIDAAVLLQACLQDPTAAHGLRHGSMWFGARRHLDSLSGVLPPIEHMTRLERRAQIIARLRLREVVPRSFYEKLLAADWPETHFPNKEGSDNDEEEGNVRHEAIATPRGTAAAFLHHADSRGGTVRPPFGPRHPANKVLADLGVILHDSEFGTV
jgi:hypothetical protein